LRKSKYKVIIYFSFKWSWKCFIKRVRYGNV